MSAQRYSRAILLYLSSMLLLLGNFQVPKVVISAQFTRGVMIGAGVMLAAFATVLMLQSAVNSEHNSGTKPAADGK